MADPEVRARLISHFSNTPDQGQGWSKLWDAGDFLPWDRGTPNPALEDLLKDRGDLLGTPWTDGDHAGKTPRRKRALVPGCGRGYDVLLLASFGYDAYGLDISSSAVEKCKEFARDHEKDYPPRDPKHGAGRAAFLTGDFFKDDWLEEVDGGRTFEILYDYTFLCALPPTLRSAWAARYQQLLSTEPSSCLICLEFPTTKPPSTRGPPFGVPEKVYINHLGHAGKKIPYDEEDNLLEDQIQIQGSSQEGFERVARWQPERTHEIGKGSDWISIWQLKTQT